VREGVRAPASRPSQSLREIAFRAGCPRRAPETVLCLFSFSQTMYAAPPARRPEGSSSRAPTQRFLPVASYPWPDVVASPFLARRVTTGQSRDEYHEKEQSTMSLIGGGGG